MPGPADEDGAEQEVTVTDAARSHLANQLELFASGNACFRLHTGSGRKMSTTVAEPSPGDFLVREGTRVVLAIEMGLAERQHGKTVDIEPTDDGREAPIVL